MDLTQIPRPPVTIDALPAHPRLYAKPEAFARLTTIAQDPWFAPYAAALAKAADNALDVATFSPPGPNSHNSHLMRARAAQTRIASLAVQAHVTQDAKYARAAMNHVQMIKDWEYWSWITWRKGNSDPNAIYDLSYGENCATLAIAYDWLSPFLTSDDQTLLVQAARRGVDSFMKHTESLEKGQLAWWYGAAASNWNTVCAGGAGMLALAMYGSIPEAPEIIGRVEHSFIPYMEHIKTQHGAWPEGIGYWNYGMRYAFMYLLSYETTTGLKHKYLEEPLTKASLYFPLDFCPSGVPCSFGDVNSWRPIPFHFAMAQRVDAPDLVASLKDIAIPPIPDGSEPMWWPNNAETLLLAPTDPGTIQQVQTDIVKLYEGQDWGIIADRIPKPNLYLAVRGGTTEVPHSHRDLTSFHLVMGKQPVITNLGVTEYLDTTFSERRFELYDTTPASKNVILVNGVGITGKSTVVTQKVNPVPGIDGLHIDATSAMGNMRDGPAVKTNQRYYLLVEGAALLIIDIVEAAQFARFESRMHTPCAIVGDGPQVILEKGAFACSLTYASTAPSALYKATSMSTSPMAEPPTVLRWINKQLDHRLVHAAGFTSGRQPMALSVNEIGGKVQVAYQLPGHEPKTFAL